MARGRLVLIEFPGQRYYSFAGAYLATRLGLSSLRHMSSSAAAMGDFEGPWRISAGFRQAPDATSMPAISRRWAYGVAASAGGDGLPGECRAMFT